jgi:hypothetical protein
MPQVIPAAAAYLTNAVVAGLGAAGVAVPGAAAAAITAGVYGTVTAGIYLGVSVGLNSVARAQLPDPEVGKISRRQSRPDRFFAMGLPSRMGGAYMHWETSGATLGAVVAIHDGRLHAISGVYLNDDLVTLDGNGWVQEGADGRYGAGDLVRIKTRLGIPTETHYSEMTSLFSGTWPTTCRGDGIASLMMLATHRSRESFPKHFPNGEPIPSIVGQAVCYDWRADSTAGGSGAQRRADQSTWQPSGNPIVWLVHHEWFRCGRSWTRSIAPVLAALTAEANYCDEVIAKVGGTEPRYQFGGNCPTSLQPQARREAMLAACDGWMSTNAKGHLVIKAGRYVAPTYTLTSDHIVAYEWSALSEEETRVNKLVVSYLDASRDYTETEAAPWLDQADIDAGGFERPENLQLLWVQSRSQARRLAKRKMSRLAASRRGQIVTDLSGLNGWGQRYIRVQNAELESMADVVVEVMGAEFDPASGTCVFDVILADTAIDAWTPATEEGAAVSGSTRPGPAALTTPTIDDITPFYESVGSSTGVRLEIEATGPTRSDLTWFFRWRVTATTEWVESASNDAGAGPTVTLLTGLVPTDVTLDVQVSYLTGGGTRSDWSATTTTNTETPAEPIASLAFPGGPFRVGVASANQVDGLEGWTYARTGSATGRNADGTVETFAADVPRITDQGLLIEAAATNLLLRSQEFDNASWTKTAAGAGLAPVVTANAATAPDGTTTADQVVFNLGGSNTLSDFSTLDQSATVANATAYAASVWLRASSPVTLLCRHAGQAGYASLSVTTAWQRFTRVETSISTSAPFALGLRGGLGASGSATVEVWGAQLELGSAATSYVTTAGSTASRTADTATLVLPAGSSSDPIVVEHTGGTVSTTRASLGNPLLLDLGGGSGGGWVGNYIETVTVSPA